MQGFVKWIFRLLYAVGFAVLYYLLFSIFFDTPIEYELKQSTSRLSNTYNELLTSFDTLEQVIANIDQRDKSIYKIVFEAEPYQDSVESRKVVTAESLEKLSNNELGEMFSTKLLSTQQRVMVQRVNMTAQIEQIEQERKKFNQIPAIQPIDNKDLELLAASYGVKIHPFYKSKHFHRGVDYAVPTGTAVFATADGVVEKIETKGNTSGLSVTLNHSKYKTVYSNLDKVLVRPGSSVVRGDIIAFTGNSGLSYAPHLHYEVLLNGKNVDPLPYFFAELDMRSSARMRKIAEVAMQSFD